jgi:hypothetical protein
MIVVIVFLNLGFRIFVVVGCLVIQLLRGILFIKVALSVNIRLYLHDGSS